MSESIPKKSTTSGSCVKRCCAVGCDNNNKTHPHYSFYRFPVEKERCVKWLDAIGRLDILEKGFKIESYRVCEIHFPKSCITTYDSPSNPKNKQLTRIAKNAVPSLYLPVKRSDELASDPLKEHTIYAFQLPPRRLLLSTCPVEIVSIAPDPNFEVNRNQEAQHSGNPTNIAVKRPIINDYILQEGGYKRVFKDKGRTEVSNVIIGENVNQMQGNTLDNINHQSSAEQSILDKENCSNEECIEWVECEPSSSSHNSKLSLTTPPTSCNLLYRDNNNKNTYNNLVTKMTEKEPQNIVETDIEDNDCYPTNQQIVNIRPVSNNFLELNPGLLSRAGTSDKCNEDNIFSDADITSTKSDLNPTLDDDEMVVVVQIPDDDEMLPDLNTFNVETFNAQPENESQKIFLETDVETNTEDVSDSEDVKEEIIEDLIDISDSELI